MKHTKIIATGERIPLIGQGTANVGKNQSVDYEYLIRLGIDKGMTFLDTAECYFDGKSEEIIGNAINEIRDKVFLCTKVSSENLSFNEVLKSAERSLKRLQTDVIDLYLIHWPNYKINITETMDAFEKLFCEKKVRYFGLSNFSPIEMREIYDNIQHYNFGGFVFNQIEYNVFDRYAENIVSYCQNHKMEVMSYCPLNRGLVSHKGKGEEVLNNLSKKYNRSVYQISLNWISSKNVISIPSSSNYNHTVENSESLDFDMSSEDIDLLNREAKGDILYVSPYSIKAIKDGYGNRSVYYTKEEAIKNNLNFCPSPVDFANFLLTLNEEDLKAIKPVRVFLNQDKDSDKYLYNLYEGRIRYWAWIIAFENNKEIPIYIIKGKK